jgi:hypothetical protein
MSSSMLEQAIIDAKELKESAQRNAEEAIVEKYQSEIKEAVEKILEQEDLGLGGDLGGGMGMDAGLGMAPVGKPESAKQPEAGEDQVDKILNQLPFIQTSDENEVIELNLGKLEESLNIVNEATPIPSLVQEDEFTIDEDLLEEDFLDEVDELNYEEYKVDAESLGLEEEMLEEEDLDEEVTISDKLAKNLGFDPSAGTSLEEMIAEALEEMLGEENVLEEDEDLFEIEDLEEEKIKNPGKYADGPRAKAGVDDDGDGVPNKADKDPKDGAVQESKKLQRENKTLIKEQTRMSSKVQLLENKLDKYGTVIDQLKQKLDESNLVSAKLLYQNRVLDSDSLNERQKNRIVEAIKDAGTVEEAKIIFETLQSTVETTGKSGRKRESLDEVVYRGSSAFMPLKEAKQKVSDPFVARMQALAGLK